MSYKPNPIDTKGVKLPKSLDGLTEMLASSIHDVWAEKRMTEGWTWGTERDDTARTHPDLVPYGDLPEDEKSYDRVTARETLKAILALGYKIEAPGGEGNGEQDPEFFRALGKKLRSAGEPLAALDRIQQGLLRWPQDLRLRQLMGLALADSGAAHRANAHMQSLVNEGHQDEETLSILARTHKDLWERSAEEQTRLEHLRRAHEGYDRCFRMTGGYYPGINAATLAAILGEQDRAREIATEVRAQCLGKLDSDPHPGERYYLVATVAEAALVLENLDEALEYYRLSGDQARAERKYMDIFSTRRNARHLAQALNVDKAALEAALAIPSVAVFTGHMVDRPGRANPRFPASPALERAVAQEMKKRLKEANVGFGFSSAAAGGDILFLEALQELGVDSYVVLPYNQEQFILDSVAVDPESPWIERFTRLVKALETEKRVSYSSDWPIGSGGDAFTYANQVLFGMARLMARQLDTDLKPMALFNGERGGGPGGTDHTVEWWESMGYPVEIIDLAELVREHWTEPEVQGQAMPAQEARTDRPEEFNADIRAMLFADVVGYSKVREEHVPPFVREFLGTVARMVERIRPEVKNTWGDALYFVFSSVREAGVFALELADMVAGTDWEAKGLPKGLNLRVSLHAGPVYSCQDPVQGVHTYTGTHVSRAARIEPITPPGQVYSSQAFAALAAADDSVTEFVCDYVGQVGLAKGYGIFPVYHVRRHANG